MGMNTFTYELRGQALVICLPKEIDCHVCRDLRYETVLLLSEKNITKIIFDFGQTEFVERSCFDVLSKWYKQMMQRGRALILCGVGVQIGRELHKSGIDRWVSCFETKEAALSC